jgi:hypothetical protein
MSFTFDWFKSKPKRPILPLTPKRPLPYCIRGTVNKQTPCWWSVIIDSVYERDYENVVTVPISHKVTFITYPYTVYQLFGLEKDIHSNAHLAYVIDIDTM